MKTFRMELVAPQADIDDLGHVSNIAYVRWVQEVAIAASASVGWDRAAYDALGAVFVVRRHEIEYLRPTFAGERVALITHVEGFKAATSVRRTRIARADDDATLCEAATTWVLVGPDGRPRRIPKELVAAFS